MKAQQQIFKCGPKSKPRPQVTKKKTSAAVTNESTTCLYCCELYRASREGEEWIQWVLRREWAHCTCIEDPDVEVFVNNLCNEEE